MKRNDGESTTRREDPERNGDRIAQTPDLIVCGNAKRLEGFGRGVYLAPVIPGWRTDHDGVYKRPGREDTRVRPRPNDRPGDAPSKALLTVGKDDV
jgi:hypothetical protein